MKNVVHLIDCMEFMKTVPDKFFDLAVVDPQYGIGVGGSKSFGKVGGSNIVEATKYKLFDDSTPPSPEWFIELFRISKNQIIWGGNYFIDNLRSTPCMLVWDKKNTGNFADCEIAWTSFDTAVRIFRYRWNGMLQENMKHKEKRIHPTQKPVDLYKWTFQNYAKPGWKIFDSHIGSGSSRIAAYDMGFSFEGCELDRDYWEAQEERFKNHISNVELFNKEEIQESIYQEKLL